MKTQKCGLIIFEMLNGNSDLVSTLFKFKWMLHLYCHFKMKPKTPRGTIGPTSFQSVTTLMDLKPVTPVEKTHHVQPIPIFELFGLGTQSC